MYCHSAACLSELRPDSLVSSCQVITSHFWLLLLLLLKPNLLSQPFLPGDQLHPVTEPDRDCQLAAFLRGGRLQPLHKTDQAILFYRGGVNCSGISLLFGALPLSRDWVLLYLLLALDTAHAAPQKVMTGQLIASLLHSTIVIGVHPPPLRIVQL